ncbi:leucine-rich repeat protein [Anaerosacchariphilus polymeriproducens]|uniref:Leucine-rich repeat domain-containing protein n=1 Tax=Anaerosacchariphilus polymeriproducens TaxID=1812858 RepID=A0A371AYC3_9FIRM|nr:leucine-rich repeat domain-containing protein [Anaerosacchariphilus polymeriproducens]RDU24566.1 leucine-rich repeat domain-containing protein [Anaerosacchariphilus polymeriproducens]
MKKILKGVVLLVLFWVTILPFHVNAAVGKVPKIERTCDYRTKELEFYICNCFQTSNSNTASNHNTVKVAIRNTTKQVKIPEEVSIKGIRYTVTGIVPNAKEYSMYYADKYIDLNRDIKIYRKNTKTQVISIPKTVITIEDGSFNRFTKLKKFKVSSGNKKFKTVKGTLLSKSGKILYAGVSTKGTYYVPAGVQSIAKRAFAYSTVKRIVLPKSCKKIDSRAFYKCMKLKKINLKQVNQYGANAFFKTKIKKIDRFGNLFK